MDNYLFIQEERLIDWVLQKQYGLSNHSVEYEVQHLLICSSVSSERNWWSSRWRRLVGFDCTEARVGISDWRSADEELQTNCLPSRFIWRMTASLRSFHVCVQTAKRKSRGKTCATMWRRPASTARPRAATARTRSQWSRCRCGVLSFLPCASRCCLSTE